MLPPTRWSRFCDQARVAGYPDVPACCFLRMMQSFIDRGAEQVDMLPAWQPQQGRDTPVDQALAVTRWDTCMSPCSSSRGWEVSGGSIANMAFIYTSMSSIIESGTIERGLCLLDVSGPTRSSTLTATTSHMANCRSLGTSNAWPNLRLCANALLTAASGGICYLTTCTGTTAAGARRYVDSRLGHDEVDRTQDASRIPHRP